MEIGFSPTQGGHTYDEFLEQVRYADENGLASVFLQEHHEPSKVSWPDPITVLSGAATVTDQIRLGTAVLLLPLYHPVRLAERAATLDGLSDGRFVMGAALGYNDRDFEVMNVERRERARMYREYLTLVSRAWSERTLSFDGHYFQLDEFTLAPEPASDPRPEIWMGGYHPKALERAADFVERGLADAWLPGTQPDFDGIAGRVETFDEMLAERSLDRADVPQPLFRDGIVAPSLEEAEEMAVEYVYPSYEEVYGGDSGADKDESDRGDLGADVAASDEDPMDLIRDRVIVGSPDEWVDHLRRYEEATGTDHVVVRLAFPEMSHEQVMDQLELISDEVLSKL